MKMNSRTRAQTDDIDAALTAKVEAMPRRSGQRKLLMADPNSINREVLIALAAVCTPELLADRVMMLVNATRINKAGEEEPDIRAMEAGLKLAYSYLVGLPIQRQQVMMQHSEADGTMGLAERMKHSPALRESFRKMLADADAKTDG